MGVLAPHRQRIGAIYLGRAGQDRQVEIEQEGQVSIVDRRGIHPMPCGHDATIYLGDQLARKAEGGEAPGGELGAGLFVVVPCRIVGNVVEQDRQGQCLAVDAGLNVAVEQHQQVGDVVEGVIVAMRLAVGAEQLVKDGG
jgi:hypothetical protein